MYLAEEENCGERSRWSHLFHTKNNILVQKPSIVRKLGAWCWCWRQLLVNVSRIKISDMSPKNNHKIMESTFDFQKITLRRNEGDEINVQEN